MSTFTCPLCGGRFATADLRDEHEAQAHPNICPKCGARFQSAEELTHHEEMTHIAEV
jgi:transcription elongation factor Elf1